MAKVKPTKMLAVLGRCRRTGRWRVAPTSEVLAVLGSCSLDMRHSFVDGDDVLKMKVTVVFGSATFLLPDGAEVKPSGFSFLASSLVDVPELEEECRLPTVEIEWTCLFGRLQIVTETSLAAMNGEVAPAPVVEPEPEPEPEVEVEPAGEGGDVDDEPVEVAVDAGNELIGAAA